MQRLQFGLFGRLATADALGARRSLAARVFNFALQQPGSGAQFRKRSGFWHSASSFLWPFAWRGCKAGCALESACCATGVAATCSCAVSWGIDGIAVPCGLCRLSAAFAQWQQHSFLTTPVVSASGVDVRHVVAITPFRMAELPGTLKGMLPTAFVVLPLALCCMPFASVRSLIHSATLGWDA